MVRIGGKADIHRKFPSNLSDLELVESTKIVLSGCKKLVEAKPKIPATAMEAKGVFSFPVISGIKFGAHNSSLIKKCLRPCVHFLT